MENAPPFIPVLAALEQTLKDTGICWLVGGSCGLLLQRVRLDKPPRDLDLYVDQDDVSLFHERLREWALDEPSYSETPIYRSTLSHYQMNGVQIELVAGFQVQSYGCDYRVTVRNGLFRHSLAAEGERPLPAIRLMPLAHELVFNVLRDRPDRYEAIAEVMQSRPERHIPVIRDIIRTNVIVPPVLAALERLLNVMLA